MSHCSYAFPDSAAQYAPGLMAGIGALLHRMTQLELTMAQLALSGAMTAAGTANRYILVRNLQNMPTCEPLQKTVCHLAFSNFMHFQTSILAPG